MTIQLPNLSEKRFQEIFEEFLATIPKYSNKWSNYNPSDPGVTILELFSWLAENTLYRIDRIPESLYVNFLKLVAGASSAEEINKLLLEEEGIDLAYQRILKFLGDVEHIFHPGSFKNLTGLVEKFWKARKYLFSIEFERDFYEQTYRDYEKKLAANPEKEKENPLLKRLKDEINSNLMQLGYPNLKLLEDSTKKEKLLKIMEKEKFLFDLDIKYKDDFFEEELSEAIQKEFAAYGFLGKLVVVEVIEEEKEEEKEEEPKFCEVRELESNNLFLIREYKNLLKVYLKNFLWFFASDQKVLSLNFVKESDRGGDEEIGFSKEHLEKLEFLRDLFEISYNKEKIDIENVPSEILGFEDKDLKKVVLENKKNKFILKVLQEEMQKFGLRISSFAEIVDGETSIKLKDYKNIYSVEKVEKEKKIFFRVYDWDEQNDQQKRFDELPLSYEIQRGFDDQNFLFELESDDINIFWDGKDVHPEIRAKFGDQKIQLSKNGKEIFLEVRIIATGWKIIDWQQNQKFSAYRMKSKIVFYDNTLLWLDRYDGVETLSKYFQRDILTKLNLLLRAGPLYSDKMFFLDMKMSEELVQLIAKERKTSEELVMFNRLFLEAVYFENIKATLNKDASELKKEAIRFLQTPYRAITEKDIKELAKNISYQENSQDKVLSLDRIIIKSPEKGNSQENTIRILIVPDPDKTYNNLVALDKLSVSEDFKENLLEEALENKNSKEIKEQLTNFFKNQLKEFVNKIQNVELKYNQRTLFSENLEIKYQKRKMALSALLITSYDIFILRKHLKDFDKILKKMTEESPNAVIKHLYKNLSAEVKEQLLNYNTISASESNFLKKRMVKELNQVISDDSVYHASGVKEELENINGGEEVVKKSKENFLDKIKKNLIDSDNNSGVVSTSFIRRMLLNRLIIERYLEGISNCISFKIFGSDIRKEIYGNLLDKVKQFFEPRMIIGNSLNVDLAEETLVHIKLSIVYFSYVEAEQTNKVVEKKIRDYLHPLIGGTRRTGWPYNKPLSKKEIEYLLKKVNGVKEILVTLINPFEPDSFEQQEKINVLGVIRLLEPIDIIFRYE